MNTPGLSRTVSGPSEPPVCPVEDNTPNLRATCAPADRATLTRMNASVLSDIRVSFPCIKSGRLPGRQQHDREHAGRHHPRDPIACSVDDWVVVHLPSCCGEPESALPK